MSTATNSTPLSIRFAMKATFRARCSPAARRRLAVPQGLRAGFGSPLFVAYWSARARAPHRTPNLRCSYLSSVARAFPNGRARSPVRKGRGEPTSAHGLIQRTKGADAVHSTTKSLITLPSQPANSPEVTNTSSVATPRFLTVSLVPFGTTHATRRRTASGLDCMAPPSISARASFCLPDSSSKWVPDYPSYASSFGPRGLRLPRRWS